MIRLDNTVPNASSTLRAMSNGQTLRVVPAPGLTIEVKARASLAACEEHLANGGVIHVAFGNGVVDLTFDTIEN